MYYDNKSTFYIKEYGPSVIITVVSIILILSGVFIYYNTAIKPNSNTVIADSSNSTNKNENVLVEENNPLINVEKNEEIVEELKEEKVKDNTYFVNLPNLTKSNEVIVKFISDDFMITVENSDSKIDFKLIGVDTSFNSNNLLKKIREDLLNKNIKIAFDKVKVENNIYKAYIFLDKNLYNAELLKNGFTTILSERNNYSLNNKLSQAQKYARSNSLGVWKK